MVNCSTDSEIEFCASCPNRTRHRHFYILEWQLLSVSGPNLFVNCLRSMLVHLDILAYTLQESQHLFGAVVTEVFFFFV